MVLQVTGIGYQSIVGHPAPIDEQPCIADVYGHPWQLPAWYRSVNDRSTDQPAVRGVQSLAEDVGIPPAGMGESGE